MCTTKTAKLVGEGGVEVSACSFFLLKFMKHLVSSISIRDGREESITRVLLVTNELGWWTGILEFAYTHTNKVF